MFYRTALSKWLETTGHIFMRYPKEIVVFGGTTRRVLPPNSLSISLEHVTTINDPEGIGDVPLLRRHKAGPNCYGPMAYRLRHYAQNRFETLGWLTLLFFLSAWRKGA